jgi:hypothetical protein
MEQNDAPDGTGRMDVPWDLRDLPLDRLSDTAEAKQVVDSILARAAGPWLEVMVAGFSSSV